MVPSQPAEFDPQWEFDCPKWRDLRRADDFDDADSWFGDAPLPADDAANSTLSLATTAATASRARGKAASGHREPSTVPTASAHQHKRAASSSHPHSERGPQLPSQHSRVKHKSDSVLCLSQPAYSHLHSHPGPAHVYPVLPVRSVTPLTQPEPFQLTTAGRGSRAAVSQVSASTNKENKRPAVSNKVARPQSQSVKHKVAAAVPVVSDVVSRLYTVKPQPLTVRTNRSEVHGQPSNVALTHATNWKSTRSVQPSSARPSHRASIAASPAVSRRPSPRSTPSPRPSPTSSPLCSVRRITRPLPFRLASSVRAEQRRRWDAARSQVSAQRAVSAAAVENEKAAAERVDRRHLRHSLVHQPLPMPAFESVFVPEKSRHTLTAPESPKLQTKLRASVGQTLSRQQHNTATSSTQQRLRGSSRW